eukprot:7083550-Lingulodinium_polyedra.AAC.1
MNELCTIFSSATTCPLPRGAGPKSLLGHLAYVSRRPRGRNCATWHPTLPKADERLAKHCKQCTDQLKYSAWLHVVPPGRGTAAVCRIVE